MAEEKKDDAEEQATRTVNRRPQAEDLRLMHQLDGIFDQIEDPALLSLVLTRLLVRYAPAGFAFSKKEANGND